MYDLSEMGRANTLKMVTYGIDLTNTFYFLKDRGSATGLSLVLNGTVSEYQYLPGWTRYRNDLATVGTLLTGGVNEIVAQDAGEIVAHGRRQDVTTLRTLIGASGSTATDQQVAALQYQLTEMSDLQPALALKLERGFTQPWNGWDINDIVNLEIVNGIDNITGTARLTGVRALYTEIGEQVTVLVDRLAGGSGGGNT